MKLPSFLVVLLALFMPGQTDAVPPSGRPGIVHNAPTATPCSRTYTFSDGTSLDGCSGAPSGTPQLPSILASYGSNRAPWNVAAVDYYVGIASGTVLLSAATHIPAACTYNGTDLMDCRGTNNQTIQNLDFTAITLLIDGHGHTIKNNKFALNCGASGTFVELVLYDMDAGTTTVTQNLFDDTACPNSSGGTQLNVRATEASAVINITYNEFRSVAEDGVQYAGPPSGSSAFNFQYNLINNIGLASSGHPDGFQWGPGAITNGKISLNTYYNQYGHAIAQPFHVQPFSSGVVTNPLISYNTVISLSDGTQCTSGSYPTHCTGNQSITCEQDSGDTVTNFKAYGNYLDVSGVFVGLLNYPNNSTPSCPTATWGSGTGFENNINMNGGASCAVGGSPC